MKGLASIMPDISVICPSYNHEKYINFFIESILKQTHKNFELVIVDDCSSDNNIKEIEKYNDKRIKLIKHKYNKGFSAALNTLIDAAESEIIALCASDDILDENYLKEILEMFNNSPENAAVYVSLDCIDENNKPMNIQRIFKKDISEFELLKRSFMDVNQLPSPGMAFRKSVLNKPLPEGLIQYSDWDLHNKILLSGSKIQITEKCLVKYRCSNTSASARNPNVLKREFCETDIMMNEFLKINDLQFFKNIFCGVYEKYGEPTLQALPYFLGRIALESSDAAKRLWGYKTVINFISDKENYALINRLFNIDFKTIINLVSSVDFEPENIKKKIKKLNKQKTLLAITIFVLTILLFGEFLCLMLR